MTLSKLKKPAPWTMEQAFLSFNAVFIAFLLTFSLFAFGTVDLWAQTAVNAGLWLRLLLHSCGKSADTLFRNSATRSVESWILLLGILWVSASRSGAPDRSQQEWWMWTDYFLIYLIGARLTEAQQNAIIESILFTSIMLCSWGWYQLVILHQLPQGPLLNSNVFASYLLILPVSCVKTLGTQSLVTIRTGAAHLNSDNFNYKICWSNYLIIHRNNFFKSPLTNISSFPCGIRRTRLNGRDTLHCKIATCLGCASSSLVESVRSNGSMASVVGEWAWDI